MKFVETKLRGAFVIEPDRIDDERGFFARTFCQDEFSAHGLNGHIEQCNVSLTRAAGTLRGLHFQIAPHAEAKLIRCTMGAIYDVVVDMREGSPTRRQWIASELTAENRRMIYAPEGFAHGFVTLTANCEVFYQMSAAYHAASARGLRWNDPALAIDWPVATPSMSARDRDFPLLDGTAG